MKLKRIAALGLTLAMASTLLVGCGCSVDSDTPIIGSLFGLEDDQVFKIEKNICTKPEYMLQLMDSANSYKAGLGGKVDWNAKVTKEKTLADQLLDTVKESASVRYAMAAMAKENKLGSASPSS